MQFRILVAVLIIGIQCGGCIWIDDDDGIYIPGGELEETVLYINRTGYFIDNIIDDEFVGTVGPYETLRVVSMHLDGPHVFYSTCRDCSLTWGPTTFTLGEGEIFRIYLEESGMRGDGKTP